MPLKLQHVDNLGTNSSTIVDGTDTVLDRRQQLVLLIGRVEGVPKDFERLSESRGDSHEVWILHQT